MQHPFEGILSASRRPSMEDVNSAQAIDALPAPFTSRRLFFAKMFAAAAGALAVFTVRSVSAQRRAEQGRRGEAGRPSSLPWRPSYDSGEVTTQALGEEGGGWGQVTTYALGEEGAAYPPGGWPPPSGPITTQALGEEGGRPSLPRYRRDPPPFYRPPRDYPPRGRYTTQALGEEGGWWF
jgi:hypothetical protein